MMSEFDRLIEGVEEHTGESPTFQDDSEVFGDDTAVMIVEDDVRYLAVPMPARLTSEVVDHILEHVDQEWDSWVEIEA